MNILFDIGHPAHVHYFKNIIKHLNATGHKTIIVARKRSIIFELLKFYNIEFISRGKGKNSLIGKLFYMLIADIKMILVSIKHKPDLFISFSSPYASQVSYLLKKKHISINDTEHTDKIHKIFTYRFSTYLLTPKYYINNLGSNHYRFNNIMEGFYLNDKVFKPDPSVFEDLQLNKGEKYAIIRLISWTAHHDYGQSGIEPDVLKKIISVLEKNNYKIFLSSERNIPDFLSKYKLNTSPEKIHSVLYYSSFFIGESATMASESAYLGVPTIYINSLPLMGYLSLEQKFHLLKHFKNGDGLVPYVKKILGSKSILTLAKQNSKKMKENFEDPNKFLFEFIHRKI